MFLLEKSAAVRKCYIYINSWIRLLWIGLHHNFQYFVTLLSLKQQRIYIAKFFRYKDRTRSSYKEFAL